MDQVLGYFGIYDFLGIWGPGAIMVTYFLCTMKNNISSFLKFLNIELPSISEKYILLMLYSVVAYVVGVILHEVGKFIVGRIQRFKIERVKQNAYSEKILDSENILNRKIFYAINLEYKRIIEKTIPDKELYCQIEFDKANNYLKYTYKGGTGKIDKYHSIYALARSLSLCFSIHLLAYSFAMLISGSLTQWCFMAVFDMLVALVFWVRTYRYFCSWIRNILIQYYLVFLEKKEDNAVDNGGTED